MSIGTESRIFNATARTRRHAIAKIYIYYTKCIIYLITRVSLFCVLRGIEEKKLWERKFLSIFLWHPREWKKLLFHPLLSYNLQPPQNSSFLSTSSTTVVVVLHTHISIQFSLSLSLSLGRWFFFSMLHTFHLIFFLFSDFLFFFTLSLV